MMASPDWIQFVLDRPMLAEPGSHYEYCSPGMHLLSGIIAQATGASTLDFARRVLFGPLGIERAAWPADPQGISYGWGDLHLEPRDMAKIGYLWLNGGRWEDRQVVPADWMRAAVQVHSRPGFSKGQQYGYGIWVYPDRTPPEFEGLGRAASASAWSLQGTWWWSSPAVSSSPARSGASSAARSGPTGRCPRTLQVRRASWRR